MPNKITFNYGLLPSCIRARRPSNNRSESTPADRKVSLLGKTDLAEISLTASCVENFGVVVARAAALDHISVRRTISLLGDEESEQWKAKLAVAERVRDLIQVERKMLKGILSKHGKRKKTKEEIESQIKDLEGRRLAEADEILLTELKIAKLIRNRKCDFFQERLLVSRVTYERFQEAVQRIVRESKQKELIRAIKDEEIIALTACVCVKSDRFKEKTSKGFLQGLPDWFIGNKDPRSELHMGVAGRFIFLELCELTTARDIEEFEKWDLGVFDQGFDKLRKQDPVDVVYNSFSRLCCGTDPAIRLWNLRCQRWDKPVSYDLASDGSAWFLFHQLKVVRDNGTFDVEKMRGMSEWGKKLTEAKLDSMYINCPHVPDVLSVFRIGSQRLRELGLVKHDLVGIGKDQFRPWDYKRNNIENNHHQRRLARLEMIVKMNDEGLGVLTVNENAAVFVLTKKELIEWAASIPKRLGYLSMDQFLRKRASTAFRVFARNFQGAVALIFSEPITGGMKSAGILQSLRRDEYRFDFDLTDFPEFSTQDELSSSDFFVSSRAGEKLAHYMLWEAHLVVHPNFRELPPISLRERASDIGYEILNLGNMNYKREIIGDKRNALVRKYNFMQAALMRIAEIRERGSGRIISPEMDFFEFKGVVKEAADFNKLPFDRVTVLVALVNSLKTERHPKRIFAKFPDGALDSEGKLSYGDHRVVLRYVMDKNYAGEVSLDSRLNEIGLGFLVQSGMG